MADEENPKEDSAEGAEEGSEENKGGGKKKLIIMIVGALLVIGGGAGGAMFFMGGGDEEVVEGAEEEVVEEPKDIAYLPFVKPLVVNFQSADGKTRFLKTEVTLMTENEDRLDDIEKHLPKISHIVNLVFSRQNFEELGTPEGKEKMRAEALEEVQKVLKESMGEKNVDDILYTTFVTQ